jgi:hypothetical protein
MAAKQASERAFQRLTSEELAALDLSIPYDASHSRTCNSDKLGIAVLRWYFGDNWLKKYIYNTRSETFLNQIGSVDVLEHKRLRRIFLAEMLYNLQGVRNFALCWDELYIGKIESTYAVLDIVKLLYTKAIDIGLRVCFIPTAKHKGRRRPDFLISFSDGARAFGEVKSKQETTDVTIAKLKDSLSDAKEQLPKRSPGFVFVKVHKTHADNEYFSNEMERLAVRSLSRSPWVAAINYIYTHQAARVDKLGYSVGEEILAANEVHNPSCKFQRFEWREIFPPSEKMPPPGMDYNGQPNWQRMIWPAKIDPTLPRGRGKET